MIILLSYFHEISQNDEHVDCGLGTFGAKEHVVGTEAGRGRSMLRSEDTPRRENDVNGIPPCKKAGGRENPFPPSFPPSTILPSHFSRLLPLHFSSPFTSPTLPLSQGYNSETYLGHLRLSVHRFRALTTEQRYMRSAEVQRSCEQTQRRGQ